MTVKFKEKTLGPELDIEKGLLTLPQAPSPRTTSFRDTWGKNSAKSREKTSERETDSRRKRRRDAQDTGVEQDEHKVGNERETHRPATPRRRLSQARASRSNPVAPSLAVPSAFPAWVSHCKGTSNGHSRLTLMWMCHLP